LVAVLAKGAARRPAPDTVHSTCCLMCARTAVRRNIDRRMCVGGGMSLVTLSTVVSRPFGMVSSRVFWNGRHIPSDRHVRSARERVGHDSKCVSIISASTGFCDYCIHGQTCRGAQNSSHICMSDRSGPYSTETRSRHRDPMRSGERSRSSMGRDGRDMQMWLLC
jgi:hypothetical protein